MLLVQFKFDMLHISPLLFVYYAELYIAASLLALMHNSFILLKDRNKYPQLPSTVCQAGAGYSHKLVSQKLEATYFILILLYWLNKVVSQLVMVA